MSETATIKTWSQRFKFIAKAAAGVTAVIGVATALFGSYHSFQEAKGARLDTGTSYEALVSKMNAMAERLAFLEGKVSSMGSGPVAVAPVVVPPRPPPEVMAVASDKDGVQDLPPPVKRTKKFKIHAYQQLPSSLDSLIKSKDAYAE